MVVFLGRDGGAGLEEEAGAEGWRGVGRDICLGEL